MKLPFAVALAAFILFLNASAAHAYLDPGSGSMLLQVILGGVAGLLVAGKLFWAQILDFLGIRKIPTSDEDSESSDG